MADDKVLITEGTLDNIADAIREKNGENHLYYPREMPAAIRRIPTGSGSGSVVAVYPILLDGTHIADIEVDGENFAIYAPTPKIYTQGTGIEISQNGVVSVSEALRTTIAGKVDTSTFTTAIANLTASLASKQDLLVQGNGITIQGNTISADVDVSDISDVDLSSLADGQVLKYNSTSQKWENANESGGTTVVANPSGTPTDELNTIQIGEDIYEIVGGGGGGSKVVDLIYENANRTIENSIVLDSPYTDYDFLVLEISDIAQYSYKLQTMIVLKEQLDDAKDTGNYISFYQAANAYLQYTVTNTTTLTKDNAAYECITKVYGVKMGGGGTTVEANPSETPTDQLTSIKIDNTVYEIVGGGGSGFDTTVLWDYKTDNNNSVLYGLNSATLHDSAENYDALVIEVVSIVSDETDATWKGTCQFFVDVNALDNAFNEKYIICESVANRSCKYHIDGTTLQKTAEATANTNGLVRVYGIKYGSGGGSGSGVKRDVLLSTPTAYSRTQVTLAHNISDYDLLEFTVRYSSSANCDDVVYIWANDFKTNYPYNASASSDATPHLMLSSWNDNSYMRICCGDADNKIFMFQGSLAILQSVAGLKFSGGGSGGASALEDLTDVDLSSLSNGQILKYNSTTQKWENDDEKTELPNVASSYSNVFLGADYSDNPQVKWVKDKTSNSYGINKITEIQSGKWTGFSYRLSDDVYHNSNDAYDSAATYNTGDYCIYLNKWYKCKADNTTGSWDSTKWDEVPLSDLLPLIGQGGGLPFNVVIDSNDNGINLVYDDGQ